MYQTNRSLSLLSLVVALAVAGSDSQAACRSGNVELTILSSTASRGEVKDCGCKTQPKGGLARRVGLVDSLRARSGELLLIDAGDYIHPVHERGDQLNWFILETMGEMGYDAMTLGELELLRGADYVRSILDATRVPITLANARFADTGKPVGELFLIRQRLQVRCAVIGLISEEFSNQESSFNAVGFRVDDPVSVAAKLVPEVGADADLVVVLAHMVVEEATRLAEAVPGIDLIVLGHRPGTGAPIEVGETLLVKPGQRGQYVGETRIVLDPANEIVSYVGESVAVDVALITENSRVAGELEELEAVAAD
jgi:2',3'-cyclic-nucleotide 2'-phosphodiesterase (5'-nucleotidase family)